MSPHHFRTEVEWRRWFAQQMAPRETPPIERKWIQSVADGKPTGELRHTRPVRLRRRGR